MEIIKNKTIILLSKNETVTYHAVGGLDSGMCCLTDKNGKVFYVEDNDFVWFVETDEESLNDKQKAKENPRVLLL